MKHNRSTTNTHFTAAMLFNADKEVVQSLRTDHDLGEKELMRAIINVALDNPTLLAAEVQSIKDIEAAEIASAKALREAAKADAKAAAAKARADALEKRKQEKAEKEAAAAAEAAKAAADKVKKGKKAKAEPQPEQQPAEEPVVA